jgi:outer membrane receptor protein involved in Fe transport
LLRSSPLPSTRAASVSLRFRLTTRRAGSGRALCGFAAGLLFCAAVGGTTGFSQTVTLAPEVVTATRTPQPVAQVAFSAQSFDGDDLRAAPALSLDGVLRSAPGFSLFRRSDSLSANPTAQGVSLRGLGPSGASRSLVLLDGVPLNDPFGGWIAWSKIPRENLRRIEVVPGGGATAWGNAALSGVIQMLGEAPEVRTTRAAATVGDYGTRSFEFAHTEPAGRSRLDLAARAFATDGFTLVAPERRGPIDTAAWSRHRWLNARWRQSWGEAVEVGVSFRGYEELRGNGTPFQHNGTREKFGSVTLAGQPAASFGWNAVAYAQDQSFASTFSSVNAARSAETPASDQFAVPATAAGAAGMGTWRHPQGARTSAGADVRRVRGETRENFTFSNGTFLRERLAGGEQTVGGLFLLHDRPVGSAVHATVGGRFDAWRESDGHRRESDRATGAVLRQDRYPNQDGTAFSPSAGLIWTAAPLWRVRASAQHAFRRPTLNELYRPFRAGANVTEANAALRTEQVTSGELGLEFGAPGGPGAASWPGSLPFAFGATLFANDFRDAVGNVTIARGPGTFPIVGAIPAGGFGRQRLNLDRTRVQGLELTAGWQPVAGLHLAAAFLVNDATVRRAAAAPGLAGKRVAQVPRRSGSLSATWRAPAGVVINARIRGIGRQFEDDENQLILGAVAVADLGVSRPLTRRLTLFLNAENLGGARIETGRSADGVVNTGTPRLVTGGVRGRW